MPSKICVNLRFSFWLAVIAAAVLSLLGLFLCFAPWSPHHEAIKLGLLLMLGAQSVLAYRDITQLQGKFQIDQKNIIWRGQTWQVQSVVSYRYLIWLSLFSPETQRTCRFLLCADSMTTCEWRTVCYHLLILR